MWVLIAWADDEDATEFFRTRQEAATAIHYRGYFVGQSGDSLPTRTPEGGQCAWFGPKPVWTPTINGQRLVGVWMEYAD